MRNRAVKKAIGRYLKEVRLGRSLTLREVSALSNSYGEPVEFSYLHRCENGEYVPTITKLYTLAGIYGIPFQQFLLQVRMTWLKASRSSSKDTRRLRSEATKAIAAGYLGDAVALLEQARDAAERRRNGSGNTREAAQLSYGLATVLMQMGRIDEATDYAQGALQHDVGDELHCKTHVLLIELYRRSGNFVLANDSAVRAAELARGKAGRGLETVVAASVGNVRFSQGEFDDALKRYRKAERDFAKQKNLMWAVAAKANAGACQIELGRNSAGLATLDEALADSRDLGDGLTEARALIWLGASYLRVGKKAEAEESFEESSEISRDLDARLTLFVSSHYLWQLARQRRSRKDKRKFFDELCRLRAETDSDLGEPRSLPVSFVLQDF